MYYVTITVATRPAATVAATVATAATAASSVKKFLCFRRPSLKTSVPKIFIVALKKYWWIFFGSLSKFY